MGEMMSEGLGLVKRWSRASGERGGKWGVWESGSSLGVGLRCQVCNVGSGGENLFEIEW